MAEYPAAEQDPAITAAPREDHAAFVSLLTRKQEIDSAALQLFQLRLRKFADLLGRKLPDDISGTGRTSPPIREKVGHILNAPGAAIHPEDVLYKDIETILKEIGRDPMLALTFAEALQPADRDILATIRPDRGHGAVYRKDESIQFRMTALRDCYVQVLFLTPETDTPNVMRLRPLLLYPDDGNHFAPLRAGQTIILGGNDEFIVQPPYGRDLVLVVASERELPSAAAIEEQRMSPPLQYDRLFAALYGEENIGMLSFTSSFFESRPSAALRGGTEMSLLTEQEAEALRLNAEEWRRPPLVFRSIQAGPLIRVHEPTLADEENPTIAAATPMNLRISFEENTAPVNMDSLEVTAKKGFFSKSITDRVKAYIQGTILDAREIEFPRGKFRIQVEIADVEGVITTREYRLLVE